MEKDSARIEACGTIDELNALLGLVQTEDLPDSVQRITKRIQNELFEAGAELATLDPDAHATRTIGLQHVDNMEADIDRYEASLEPVRRFILPGGNRPAAMLHMARALCRRAERRLVTMARKGEDEVSPTLLAYFNRLSDLLFVLARIVIK